MQSDHELIEESHSRASLYGNSPRPLHGEHQSLPQPATGRSRGTAKAPNVPPKCSTGGALAFDQDVICCSNVSGCPDALIF